KRGEREPTADAATACDPDSIFRQRKTHLLIPAALKRPSLERSASSRSRGRRECRVLSCTRSPLANGKKAHQHSRYRNRPNIGIPCAMVLTAASRSPWSAGLVSLHRPAIRLAELDPSVGGSGPHDLAVRTASHVWRCAASIASRANES